jgi:hypothetical protein
MGAPIASEEPPPFLRWDSLAAVTSSRILWAYQIAVVVIPFATVILEVVSRVFPVYLPLTWALSYFAGLCFFAAIVIVHTRCPDINKVGRDFQSFQREGRTLQYILQQVRDLYLRHAAIDPAKANHFLRCMLSKEGYVLNYEGAIRNRLEASDSPTALSREALWTLIEDVRWNPDAAPELFWTLHWFGSSTSPRSRAACFGALVIGFIFVGAVMALQILKIVSKISW